MGGEQEVSLAKKPLPVGVWCSAHWPVDDKLAGQALVLWDLDQGSWEPAKMCAWLENISRLAAQELGCDECAFVGCLNERAGGRRHWHPVLDVLNASQSSPPTGGWCGRSSKLVVVPCRKQAVDERLRCIGLAAIECAAAPPRALILVTHDSDFVPIFAAARERGVRTLLIRWRQADHGGTPKNTSKLSKSLQLEKAADVSVMVDKYTGLSLGRPAAAPSMGKAKPAQARSAALQAQAQRKLNVATAAADCGCKYRCPTCGQKFQRWGSCREHVRRRQHAGAELTKGLQQRCQPYHQLPANDYSSEPDSSELRRKGSVDDGMKGPK